MGKRRSALNWPQHAHVAGHIVQLDDEGQTHRIIDNILTNGTRIYTVHQKEAIFNGASRRVCPNSWASMFARGNGCESGNYWAKSCTWPKDSIKSCMRYVRQCLRLQCFRALTIANSHRVNEINAKKTSTQLNCILSLSLSISLHLPPSPSPRPMFVVFTCLTNQTRHSSHRKARMLQ